MQSSVTVELSEASLKECEHLLLNLGLLLELYPHGLLLASLLGLHTQLSCSKSVLLIR